MNILNIKQMTKKFYAVNAVDNISLEFDGGKIYGIIGPNGSGKTTLFNCISGIYNPECGQIIFNGKNITQETQDKIARLGIRRTFQTLRLHKSMSVAENIYSGYYTQSRQNIFHALTHAYHYKADEIKAWDQVSSWAEYFSLTPVLHSKVGGLAYGIQRKVEIARAMIANPHILILDEPAAGMNEIEKLEITNVIRKLHNPNLTIIMIEHDIKMITTLCQDIYVLNRGQLLASGTPDEIQNNLAVTQAYMGQDDA